MNAHAAAPLRKNLTFLRIEEVKTRAEVDEGLLGANLGGRRMRVPANPLLDRILNHNGDHEGMRLFGILRGERSFHASEFLVYPERAGFFSGCDVHDQWEPIIFRGSQIPRDARGKLHTALLVEPACVEEVERASGEKQLIVHAKKNGIIVLGRFPQVPIQEFQLPAAEKFGQDPSRGVWAVMDPETRVPLKPKREIWSLLKTEEKLPLLRRLFRNDGAGVCGIVRGVDWPIEARTASDRAYNGQRILPQDVYASTQPGQVKGGVWLAVMEE